jgi:hypothetical protein
VESSWRLASFIHIWGPGDPAVILPFTGITLQGLDVEPATMTDFNGGSALAFHVGTARASDGRTYNLETDIRAFEGEYVVNGDVHHGVCADMNRPVRPRFGVADPRLQRRHPPLGILLDT